MLHLLLVNRPVVIGVHAFLHLGMVFEEILNALSTPVNGIRLADRRCGVRRGCGNAFLGVEKGNPYQEKQASEDEED